MVKKEYICEAGKKSTLVITDLKTEIAPDATIILGFAGIGLIGPIVANQLTEQIPDMAEIGFMTSEYLPPIAVFYEGVLKHPFRILYSPKHNIIIGDFGIFRRQTRYLQSHGPPRYFIFIRDDDVQNLRESQGGER